VAYAGGASLVPLSATAGTLGGGLLFSLPADTNPLGPDNVTVRAHRRRRHAAPAAARCRHAVAPAAAPPAVV